MRRSALLALTAVALALGTAARAETLAIVHAQAWTGQAPTPLADATIVVTDGKITSVTSHAAAPAGAKVIDAAGYPVTAGFVNAATQVGLTEVSSARDTRDQAGVEVLGAAFDVSFGLNPNSTLVDMARADGVTRTLAYPSAPHSGPFSGLAAMTHLRDGPDILDRAKVALFMQVGGGAGPPGASRAVQWQSMRDALDEAKAPAPASARPGGREAQTAVLREVLAGRLPLAILAHRESDIRQAIRLAADYAPARVVIVGGGEAWRAARELAVAHIPVVLDPDTNLPYSFDELGDRQTNAPILAKAGVTVAFGLVGGRLEQNYNAGLALREAAGIAISNGLPYAEALKAVTVNPLAIWRKGEAAGLIAPGQAGDLVVWDGDPFEPMTNATAVIVEGKPVSLETRMDALARRYLPDPRK